MVLFDETKIIEMLCKMCTWIVRALAIHGAPRFLRPLDSRPSILLIDTMNQGCLVGVLGRTESVPFGSESQHGLSSCCGSMYKICTRFGLIIKNHFYMLQLSTF